MDELERDEQNVLDGKFKGAGTGNAERKRGFERVAGRMSK